MNAFTELTAIVARVRARWRMLMALRAWSIAAVATAVALAFAWLTHRVLAPEGLTLVLLWAVAVAAAVVCFGWAVASLRTPDRHQVARYMEERCPELDDALATAVAAGSAPQRSPMVEVVIDDALRRARDLDLNRIVSGQMLRHAAGRAAAAAVALCVIGGVSAPPAGRAVRVLAFYMFPERLALEVTPGDARIPVGQPLRIIARMSGSADGVVPVLRLRRGDLRRDVPMQRDADGFVVSFDRVEEAFKYTVAAAGTASHEFSVTVIYPPHVERIDLRYEYPAAFGMPPHVEEDGGDIYGPAGTRVRIAVHTDKPVIRGGLTFATGQPRALDARGTVLEGELTIVDDGSYRVALTDGDGLSNPGDTEYFIRTLVDRPPDVRIVRPAADRDVTPLEEVAIEARADDDFGIAALDLVYSVRGEEEKAVRFERDAAGTTVNGRRTVYLEDLKVQPGDFVAYYARARDVSRGKRSTEARSDIFFLEVKPFDGEFVAAQSQAAQGGSGGNAQIQTLIEGQKDVIAATWKLDRRGRESGGRSQDDIRAVARAQGELRNRAQAAASQLRRAADPNRNRFGRPAAPSNAAPAEDPMSKAAEAMGRAQRQLESLKTSAALPYEMTALNELLRADAEVRRREVQRQQANSGGGRGQNRQQQDLSSLFDRELARQQQTNYETPNSRETREEEAETNDALEKIRELARRQDALNREQQDLAKKRESMSEEEFRRQLEKLTRDQTELRRQAEELSRQMQQSAQGSQGRPFDTAQGRQGRSGSSGSQDQTARTLREASEQMQNAAGELRRQDPSRASASGNRALERLRELEQRMRGAQPDDRRRALGEWQLESQQLAQEQRRLASEPSTDGTESARTDGARRRAGEQDRLADRMQRLEQGVRELANGARVGDTDQSDALAEAAREIDRQKLSERMRNAARAERENSGGEGRGGSRTSPAAGDSRTGSTPTPEQRGRQNAREQQEIAKAVERLAQRLGSANQQNEEARRLADRLSQLRELRDKLAEVDRQLSELSREGEQRDGRDSTQRNGRAGQPQQGQRGEGQTGGDSSQARSGDTRGASGAANGSSAWEQTRELVDQLRREEALGVRTPDLEGFHPGLSAPGTEAWKQDFATWEELKTQLAAALEKAESSAAAQLRDQQAKDRLNAGATQAVPDEYRQLVDKYYRALAKAGK
jgi:hypothetical protein